MKQKFSIAMSLAVILAMLLTSFALADQVANNVDLSVDSAYDTMALNVGGVNGSTTLRIIEQNGDGKNGCNLGGAGSQLTVSVASSNPSVATVSPTSVTFNACADTRTLTVTPVSQGSANITLTFVSVTTNAAGVTSSSFDLLPGRFIVEVAPPANTAPEVTVTGVVHGASYEYGTVPAAGCSVHDAEDGNFTLAATLSGISGSLSGYGLGTQTATCSFTDSGNINTTVEATYEIVDTHAPIISFVSRTAANSNGWNNGDVTVNWSCTDNVGVVSSSASQTLSGEGDNQSATGTCTDLVGLTASNTVSGIKIDKTAPTDVSGAPDRLADSGTWFNHAVGLVFTGTDALAGIDTCTATNYSEPDGLGITVNGSCTDKAGNTSAQVASSAFDYDDTAPSGVALSVTAGNLGTNNWYTSNVTVHTSGDADVSGVSCMDDQFQTSDTVGQTFNGSCTNGAGLTGYAAPLTIKLDKTAPTISGSASPAANGAGWNNTDVVVSFTCGDNLSGVASCGSSTTLSSDGAGQSASGTAVDNAGNSAGATVNGINIDKTAPSASASSSPAANGNGWNNSDVTVSFSGNDGTGSGIDTCSAAVVLSSEGAGQTASGTCTDLAGNVSAPATASGINIDKTKPTISAAVSAGTTGLNSWYVSNVTVHFTCSDLGSGILAGACPADQVLSTEAAAVASTAMTVTDVAGNTSDLSNVLTVKIDKTAPTLSWIGGPAAGGNYDFGFVPAAPTCTASDSLSGANSCSVANYSTAVGAHTMTATASDVAGNQYSETRTYNVDAWVLTGFYQPVDMNGVYNTVRNGSTVPFKFEIFTKNSGVEITNIAGITFTAVQISCDASAVIDDIEVTAAGGTSLRYDTVAGQFVYNWKTPATATKCYRVTMSAPGNVSLSANFKLK